MSNVVSKSKAVSYAKPIRSPTASVKLSKCSAKYAFAISDPFSPMASGVCVPSGQATSTHKVTGFVRLDSKIGTAGFAFIAVSPSGARDALQILISNATYSRSDVALASGAAIGPGVSAYAVSNLPYTADQLLIRAAEDNQEVVSRIASIGVAVQYTGTALNQSGMAYLYRDPGHRNVSFSSGTYNPNTIANLSSNPLTTVCNFTRDRCMVSDFAANPAEMNFISNGDVVNNITHRTGLIYPYSGGEGDISNITSTSSLVTYTTPGNSSYYYGAPTTIICITGQAGQDFHVEYVVHAEYIGNPAAASYTPTDSDPQGAGMVLEAANSIQQRKTSKPTASTWSLMYEGLAVAAKKAVPLLIPVAEKALLGLLA